MLQRGESTEQWTPLFFWMLKLSTFNGRFIYLASALMAIGFLYSIYYFIHSIPLLEEKTKSRALFVFTLTPIYGFWSVTVSHDSTFTIGFVMAISIIMRVSAHSNRTVKPVSVFVGTIFLLTSWLGYILILLFLLSLLILKQKHMALLCLFAVLTAGLSSIGVNSTREDVVFRPLLVDLKCVAQHPEAVITPGTWEQLLKISPKAKIKEVIIETTDIPENFLNIPMDLEWVKFKFLKIKTLNGFDKIKTDQIGFDKCKFNSNILDEVNSINPDITKLQVISCDLTGQLTFSQFKNLKELHLIYTLDTLMDMKEALLNLKLNKLVISGDLLSDKQSKELITDIKKSGTKVEIVGPQI
jgi:hypothetical protein